MTTLEGVETLREELYIFAFANLGFQQVNNEGSSVMTDFAQYLQQILAR